MGLKLSYTTSDLWKATLVCSNIITSIISSVSNEVKLPVSSTHFSRASYMSTKLKSGVNGCPTVIVANQIKMSLFLLLFYPI